MKVALALLVAFSSFTALARPAPHSARTEDCSQKTIYVDLGNDAFRETEDGSPPPTVGQNGGSIGAGSVVIGCYNRYGRFEERSVTAQDSVRIVLLNPRSEFDYRLLHQNGIPSTSSQEVTRTQVGVEAECADEDCARAAPAPVLPKAIPWPASPPDPNAITQQGELCARWRGRVEGLEGRFRAEAAAYEALIAQLVDWSDVTAFKLEHYRNVHQLLTVLDTQAEALDALLPLQSAARQRYQELQSFNYYQDALQKNCLELGPEMRTLPLPPVASTAADGGTPTPAHGSPPDQGLHARISSALHRFRGAMRLWRHAEEARVFGLRPVDGNTDVTVSIEAVARQGVSGAPVVVPATDGKPATTRPGPDADPSYFQFSYHVTGLELLTVTGGWAVSAYVTRGTDPAEYGTHLQSPAPPFTLFLSAHFCPAETTPTWPYAPFWKRPWCQSLGLAVGAPVQDMLASLSRGSPSAQLFFGPQFWVIPQFSISAGVADNLDGSAKYGQPGFYAAALIDFPSLIRLIQGVDKTLTP